MSTERILSNALLKKGQTALAEIWDVSASETSRKLNGETGIKLSQLAAALDAVGAKIVFEDEHIVVPREEYYAIHTLARKALSTSAL